MYHSITIGEKNTWDDWHLIPTERPFVVPPTVNTKFVDIPGMDGSLDLTENLVGRPTFGRRSGKWTFIVANGYGEWYARYSDVMNYLHGQELEVRLEDDMNYFYYGRLSVEEWKNDADTTWSNITINYELMPYKYDNFSSVEPWEWDPFYFGDPMNEEDHGSTIRDYGNRYVNGTLTMTIYGSEVPIVPDITVSAPMTITYNGVTVTYAVAGTYHAVELAIINGDSDMTFTGTGTVTVDFRGVSF